MTLPKYQSCFRITSRYAIPQSVIIGIGISIWAKSKKQVSRKFPVACDCTAFYRRGTCFACAKTFPGWLCRMLPPSIVSGLITCFPFAHPPPGESMRTLCLYVVAPQNGVAGQSPRKLPVPAAAVDVRPSDSDLLAAGTGRGLLPRPPVLRCLTHPATTSPGASPGATAVRGRVY